MIAMLLEAGADLAARTEHGVTSLHRAAKLNESSAPIIALLDAGANPKAQDKDGKTPFDLAKDNEALKGSEAYWRLNDERF